MAKRMGIMQEFLMMMKENKAYWLAPLILFFVLAALFFAYAPVIAPGIYAIF